VRQRALDQTIPPIDAASHDLNPRPQEAPDRFRGCAPLEDGSERRIVHHEGVCCDVVVEHEPFREGADKQIAGAIIEVAYLPLQLANLGARQGREIIGRRFAFLKVDRLR
jgi:hypothetical protein